MERRDGPDEEPGGTAHPDRRRALAAIGGAGLAGLAAVAAACSPGTDDASPTTTAGGASISSTASSTTTTAGGSGTTAAGASCTEIPDETNGPYPADGSNGKQILTEEGVVRSDIRSSFGSASGTATGIPLTIHLDVTDTAAGCEPMAGAAVYVWHCDAEGRYSMYSSGVTGENWLRGVQVAGDDGRVTFTSIVPGCYPGRWPHVHFEVYPDAASITSLRNNEKISQLAFPRSMLSTAYATTGYGSSARNLDSVSLEGDNVFGDDDGVHQVATMTGDPASGYVATLAVPV